MLNIAIYLYRAHQLSFLPAAERRAREEELFRDFIADIGPTNPRRTASGEKPPKQGTADSTTSSAYISMQVKNLPTSTLPADIEVMFAQCGDVAAVKLASVPSSEADIALVEMSAENAELALKRLNGYQFRNHELTVSLAA